MEPANMSTVAAPARRAEPPAPPAPAATVRHGKCSLHLSIGGTRYRLHPITPPPGFRALWSLRKQSPESSAVYQVAVEKGQAARPARAPISRSTAPSASTSGPCSALGLIPGRKARPAAARRSHARRLAEPRRPPRPARPAAVRRRLPVRRRRAEVRRHPRRAGRAEDRAIPICAACGEAFDPVVSRDPISAAPAPKGGPYK